MTNINKIMVALALVHDDLTTIHSDLTAIRSDLDKIAADTGYQAGVIRAAEGSVKALANRLKEVVGFPPAVAAAAPGETSSFPLTPEQVHDLATAIGNAVANTYAEERKAEAAKTAAVLNTYDAIRRVNEGSVEADQLPGRTGELAGKPVLVKPQPTIRPPIEERIRQLRRAGFGGYDAALLLMREHYPMQEIVRHLHVSPRRIAKLRKGEEKERA